MAQSSGFFPAGTYDVFITHGWRYDEPWNKMVALLDQHLDTRWRNWSLPWHDPSIERMTPSGRARVKKLLDGQLQSTGVVFVLQSMVLLGESRVEWIKHQVAVARAAGKPVVGILGEKGENFP